MFRFPLPHRSAIPDAHPPATSTAALRARKRPSMAAQDPRAKSLTPHRKHHKLLKDGSEVWSQDVELVFVDGLRKYWQSPWATYSRGRSRWRNQFLVDHLKKHGIDRSKKQVASHIQVLRNMWRGEPEFHLVAGGEELFQEQGILADRPKAATDSPEPGPPRTPAPDAPDYSPLLSGSSLSSTSTPDWAALDFPFDYAGVPLADPAYPASDAFAGLTPAAAAARVKLEPLAMDPSLFDLPHAHSPDTFDFYTSPPLTHPTPAPTPAPHAQANRLTSLSLWADGMAPASIDVDSLQTAAAPGAPARVLLRVHLRAAAARAPGFHGAVGLARSWGSAVCHTKTWAAGACVAHEMGVVSPIQAAEQAGASTSAGAGAGTPAEGEPLIAYLPESALSLCRNGDSVQGLTQQLVVDGEVLAVVIYTLERAPHAVAPAVELVGFQKYPWQVPQGPPRTPFVGGASPGAARAQQRMRACASLPQMGAGASQSQMRAGASQPRMSASQSQMSASRPRMSASQSQMSAPQSQMSAARSQMSAARSQPHASMSPPTPVSPLAPMVPAPGFSPPISPTACAVPTQSYAGYISPAHEHALSQAAVAHQPHRDSRLSHALSCEPTYGAAYGGATFGASSGMF